MTYLEQKLGGTIVKQIGMILRDYILPSVGDATSTKRVLSRGVPQLIALLLSLFKVCGDVLVEEWTSGRLMVNTNMNLLADDIAAFSKTLQAYSAFSTSAIHGLNNMVSSVPYLNDTS